MIDDHLLGYQSPRVFRSIHPATTPCSSQRAKPQLDSATSGRPDLVLPPESCAPTPGPTPRPATPAGRGQAEDANKDGEREVSELPSWPEDCSSSLFCWWFGLSCYIFYR